MKVDNYTLETYSGNDILKAPANRYRPAGRDRKPQDAGYILLFAHCTGSHKEVWEPTIERLFEMDKGNKGNNRILECWAVDAHSHGDAALLNEQLFVSKPEYSATSGIQYYTDAFLKLCSSEFLGKIEKGVQKVVIIGHSAGANLPIVATMRYEDLSSLPFNMIILVDPPLFDPKLIDKMTDRYKMVAKAIPRQRSIWASQEIAQVYIKSRLPWMAWDHRIQNLFLKHCLRPLPTLLLPDKKGVTLTCSPAQESQPFSELPFTFEAVAQLNKICNVLPVHAIFGERNDLFSRELQDTLHDPSVGRTIASVTRVKDAGHMVVQEQPERMAEALKSILVVDSNEKNMKLHSKL